MKNLSNSQKDYAIYLPAISGFYTKQLDSSINDPSTRKIPSFPNGYNTLNFLDPSSDTFFYGYGLYSAGHAELSLSRTDAKEWMIQARDKTQTTVIADSGGFQVATGVIKLNWDDFKGASGDKIRNEILKWCEHTADWSMTLDVPAFAATPPYSSKTGLNKFEDTLDYSLHNLHYYMKNRTPGATKFLSVLSGSDVDTSKIWYDNVKAFSDPAKVVEMGYPASHTLEGYAFAGINMRNMYCALSRFLDLIDDNIISDKNWIHFLGLGRTDWACFLTSIQRNIRKHYNPNINISFDAASPFVSVAYGLAYNYNYFNPKRWGYNMDSAPDSREFSDKDIPMPFMSPIMEKLSLKDICPYHNGYGIINGVKNANFTKEDVETALKEGKDAEYVPPSANKNGKVGKTSWDSLSYLLIMNHNVYNHIAAIQESNRLVDIERLRVKVDYRDWTRDKKKGTIEVSNHVPSSILYFDHFVEVLLDPSTPNKRQLLEDYRPMLDSISFGNYNSNSFNSLFDVDATAIEDENKFADINDEKLTELEQGLDN
ncbi:hypothetical protein RVBP17_2270 [Pseudomonas phage sp. 30-3]|uniref:Uncharacterized protein n=1 Tax=Pseudomonas phage vB_PaeM_PA5oct TaxID=2163605 RepID=A0A4Y5JU29_9CAUD|nr:hypothetical protein PQE65_gp168 [Pseudomonas phage vB_PaeM_PA5oct]WMI31861.1 hypothetical protein GBBBJNDB_00158 [Pseudomonas phage Callisto]WPK38791.1 hypothetical protein Cassandra_0115 [Pseudomonas phage Cassandra]WPK39312.1 hypothetical protein Deiofobo_0115 [Pseudomonas phage Deifobo]WPK39824.1 hypothetical protein ETTORE_0115 [Pseudomonas phage Ettore]WPK40345.1 hypothetical protein Paride_0115 [Pseudomonas phage Paride]VOH54514.1 hypothetical protein MIJ3_00158 [Pseudomonas phage v